jgi:hypothetical protein
MNDTLSPSSPPAGASVLWIMLLTAASTLTTLALACATPFPALAAHHMRRRDGVALMLAAWAVSQAVGFGLLGYACDVETLGWGAALGLAAPVSVLAAYAVMDRVDGRPAVVRLALAYVVAFVAFKAVIALFALRLGGLATTFDPGLVARQFLRNGEILIVLLLLHRGLMALGAPAPAQTKAA